MFSRFLATALRQDKHLPRIINSSQRIVNTHHHEHVKTQPLAQRSFCTPSSKGEVI